MNNFQRGNYPPNPNPYKPYSPYNPYIRYTPPVKLYPAEYFEKKGVWKLT